MDLAQDVEREPVRPGRHVDSATAAVADLAQALDELLHAPRYVRLQLAERRHRKGGRARALQLRVVLVAARREQVLEWFALVESFGDWVEGGLESLVQGLSMASFPFFLLILL